MTVGVLVRRTVPALVVGYAAHVASRLSVDGWLRRRHETPLSATWSAAQNGPDLSRAWVFSQGPSDRFGHQLGFSIISPCVSPARKSIGAVDYGCIAKHGGGFTHALYQPASRFWRSRGSRPRSSAAARSF